MKFHVGLTPRVTIIFVLFAGALLAGLGMLSYYSGRASLETGAVSELLSTAVGKESQIDGWVDAKVSAINCLPTRHTCKRI